MSEPKRYEFIYNENYCSVEREEHKEGDYVTYEDYARLKAELDKYRKDVTASVDDLLDERVRLKAELEKLKKEAGDFGASHGQVKAAMYEGYEKGWTIPQTAEAFGLRMESIRAAAKRLGLKFKSNRKK